MLYLYFGFSSLISITPNKAEIARRAASREAPESSNLLQKIRKIQFHINAIIDRIRIELKRPWRIEKNSKCRNAAGRSRASTAVKSKRKIQKREVASKSAQMLLETVNKLIKFLL